MALRLWPLVAFFVACKSLEVHQLVFSLFDVTCSSASIQLQHLSNNEVITSCTITRSIPGSSEATILPNFIPVKNSFTLTDLLPSTTYDVNVVCYDTDNVTLASGKDTIITLSNSTNTTSEATSTVPVTRLSPSTSPGLQVHTLTPAAPTWFRTEVAHTVMPSRDVWLGIVLGLLGLTGFLCGGYYVLREYRRRIRIRRFLQYRQQENEAFPDIDYEEDDGVLM